MNLLIDLSIHSFIHSFIDLSIFIHVSCVKYILYTPSMTKNAILDII